MTSPEDALLYAAERMRAAGLPEMGEAKYLLLLDSMQRNRAAIPHFLEAIERRFGCSDPENDRPSATPLPQEGPDAQS